ncbi:MAG: lysyl oxidase family protein [Limisphaerales bacterium]
MKPFLCLTFIAVALAASGQTPATLSLLPALSPDPISLTDNDLVRVPGSGQTTILLRFSNSIRNTGAGQLHIVAYRDSASPSTVDINNDSMPAFQRIDTTDGHFHDEPAGELLYHPEHHHFHFVGAAKYQLIDPDTLQVVRESPKVSFCLADVTIVDSTLSGFHKQPIYNSCVHDPYTTFAEMGISVGWEDTYDKQLTGQAFDVSELMSLPAKDYILQSTTNPNQVLRESNVTPSTASVRVRIGVGVVTKVGNSRPGV